MKKIPHQIIDAWYYTQKTFQYYQSHYYIVEHTHIIYNSITKTNHKTHKFKPSLNLKYGLRNHSKTSTN